MSPTEKTLSESHDRPLTARRRPPLAPAPADRLTDAGAMFRRREILLAGSNGFLGKVVLALLLDRYPDFKHLHILIRSKKGVPARERFEREVLESPALAPALEAIAARHGRAALRDRVTVWPADLSEPDCGFRAHDFQKLAGVGAIINCAGKVDFFPPLDESLAANVEGVQQVVALAKRLGAKLVHVSTCYVCGRADGLVEESEPILGYYPNRKAPADTTFRHDDEIRYCRERIDQISGSADGRTRGARSREIAQRLIALGRHRAEHWGWVNTYTYTKSLGEQIIAADSALDAAIVRPAIVESAYRFPFPGWIEGGRTAAPLVLMALNGMRHWPVRRDAPLEVVPVDMVAGAILAVTALLLDGRSPHRVYQLGSADVNPIHLGPLVKLLVAEARRRGRANGDARAQANSLILRLVGAGSAPRRRVRFVSAPQAEARRRRLEQRIGRLQTVMGGFRKGLETLGLPGHRTFAGWNAALRRLGLQAAFREQTLEQYLPFVLHNRYIFESENVRAAYARLTDSDRERLLWAPEAINWKRYWVENQIEGIRRWVEPQAVRDWMFSL